MQKAAEFPVDTQLPNSRLQALKEILRKSQSKPEKRI